MTVAMISPQELAVGIVVVTACIVAILYWLFRKYRVRKPQKPKDPAK